jgi:hypothetical protein
MNNKINGCVHRFGAEAGVLLPISKKKSFLLHVKVIGVALFPVGTCLYCCLFILRRLVF